jgi:hypothetical protein
MHNFLLTRMDQGIDLLLPQDIVSSMIECHNILCNWRLSLSGEIWHGGAAKARQPSDVEALFRRCWTFNKLSCGRVAVLIATR